VGISQLGVMGLVACEAAYSKGEEWYQHMLDYIKGNLEYVRNYVNSNLTGVKMIDLEGTYLVWLDFRGVGLEQDELEKRIIHSAKLWLDSGKIFGESGTGFQRINVACPRSILSEALDRINRYVVNRK
jgi:cystathionine beta-lyase